MRCVLRMRLSRWACPWVSLTARVEPWTPLTHPAPHCCASVEQIRPLVSRHHLVLVTLLLANSAAVRGGGGARIAWPACLLRTGRAASVTHHPHVPCAAPNRTRRCPSS